MILNLVRNKHIQMILQGKYAFIAESDDGERITKFMNERYSIPFHLSEQKAYLSIGGLVMRKSLSKQIIRQINRM